MAKRKVGERAEILFDSIDLKILEELSNTYIAGNGLQVFELVNRLKLEHKNLKPHIDKLLALDLIGIIRSTDSKGDKEVRLTTNSVWYENIGDIVSEFSKKEEEDLKKKISYEKNAMVLLGRAKKYLWDKENEKIISLDLRKKEDIEKNELKAK